MAENFEAVRQDALKVLRCVECARRDLAQRLRVMARATACEIVGPQGEEGAPVPEERNGIRRTCPACQTPPPDGAMHFFKHGTDEFQ
jgi:hypothetical protein